MTILSFVNVGVGMTTGKLEMIVTSGLDTMMVNSSSLADSDPVVCECIQAIIRIKFCKKKFIQQIHFLIHLKRIINNNAVQLALNCQNSTEYATDC